jgi:type I site-specific restriction endonuclease
MTRPEDAARKTIDDALTAAGWAVQDRQAMNLDAARGVAVREFPLKRGHGFADYLLYVDGEAVGVIEAKEVGTTLTGVEGQTEKYSAGLPDLLPAPVRPLPFIYQSTGIETAFTNRLDPDPRSRGVWLDAFSLSPTRWSRRCASTLARAQHLRQSVVKHAFEGKLVPQDPNDEPASVLLERIRSTQNTTERKKPRRQSTRRRASEMEVEP